MTLATAFKCWYFPSVHKLHASVFDVKKKPAAQNLQLCSVAVTSSWNFPASHGRHGDREFGEYVPGEQVLHSVVVAASLVFEKRPATHDPHEVAVD